MSAYRDLDIRISALAEHRYSVTIHGPGGDADDIFVSPTCDSRFQRNLVQLAELDLDEAAVAALGEQLFHALFVGTVREVYNRSQGMLANAENLRLRLAIPAQEHTLASLPWEFLRDPDLGPLTLLDTPIVRYLPHASPIPLLETPLPLKVLLTAAQVPPVVDVARELREVETALARLGNDVEITVVPHLTRVELQRRVREGFHIWHFAGHGSIRQDGTSGQLLLEDARGDRDAVSASELNVLLHRSGLRLVVLDACESGRLVVDSFQAIAPALVRAQIPAVVAMQFLAPDESTIAFAGEFYRSLAAGMELETCVTEGRRAVMHVSGLRAPDWGIPVIYSRSPDGRLFAVEHSKATPASSPVAPPPEPARPPDVREFVGRAAELTRCTEQLTAAHLVVITGMSGMGKTTLATALARQMSEPRKTFWHSFGKGEGLDVLIWNLAAFLAYNNQNDIWHQLQTSRQNRTPPQPAEVMFNYLIQTLRGQGYLLCFDDVQFVDEDPLFNKLFDLLRREWRAGAVSLIVTARKLPAFADGEEVVTLSGLAPEDVKRLLSTRGVDLADELVAQIVKVTGGNAQLLMLALNALQKARDPAKVIRNLDEAEDIDRYLLREVDAALDEGERAVMSAVAALLGYPASRDAIEAVLDQGSLRRVLSRLTQRHLLEVSEDDDERSYTQHAILQTFYYEQLGRRDRLAYHHRAAEYYERDEPNVLLAARHYAAAGEIVRAAELVTADISDLIGRGQARTLNGLLSELADEHFAPPLQAAVFSAQAEVAALLGEFSFAKRQLHRALEIGRPLVGAVPELAMRESQAYRYRLLALIDERTGNYAEAEHACREGLALVANMVLPNLEVARLHAQLAEVLWRRGQYDAAETTCQAGLAALPPEPAAPRERAMLLQRMAVIHSFRGGYAKAIEGLEQGLSLARQSADAILVAAVLHNLGVCLQLAGQRNQALHCYEESLRIKQQIGDVAGQVVTVVSQGNIHIELGDYTAALLRLAEAKALAERLGLRERLALIEQNIGTTYYRQGYLDQAFNALTQARHQHEKLGNQNGVLSSLCRLGDVALAQEAYDRAYDYGKQAISLAQQINSIDWESYALRIIGEARTQQGQLDEASVFLDQARQLQQQINDPFDQGLLQIAYAQLAGARNDQTAAEQAIQQGLELARTYDKVFLINRLETVADKIGLTIGR